MKEKIGLITLMFTLVCFSCSKKEQMNDDFYQKWTNFAIPSDEMDDGKDKNYGLVITVGHEAAGCNGCVYGSGNWAHYDCYGSGTACTINISGKMLSDSVNDNFFIFILDEEAISEDFYVIPDRSLYVDDGNSDDSWMNIPCQFVEKDEDGQLIFTGINFSKTPSYSNQ